MNISANTQQLCSNAQQLTLLLMLLSRNAHTLICLLKSLPKQAPDHLMKFQQQCTSETTPTLAPVCKLSSAPAMNMLWRDLS